MPAGIAEKLGKPSIFHRILARLMRQADVAIVMTDYNRIDPASLGIGKIEMIPYQLKDESTNANGFVRRESSRILYVGHLCPDKGLQTCLKHSQCARDFPDLKLELVGEPLVPHDSKIWKTRRRSSWHSGFPQIVEERTRAKVAGIQASWLCLPYGRALHEILPVLFCGLDELSSLPILATDWRGNRDVLGDNHGGILFPIDDPLANEIEQALRAALARRNDWPEWGAKNRHRFESHFQLDDIRSDYDEFVQRVLRSEEIG